MAKVTIIDTPSRVIVKVGDVEICSWCPAPSCWCRNFSAADIEDILLALGHKVEFVEEED